ncbi:MAG: hypothetical protein M3169_00975 [Candidatus Eremiobacteraeota bacterium]|nr:hypothetical protein [Candidatus Eremiobacteraeota bacterium]
MRTFEDLTNDIAISLPTDIHIVTKQPVGGMVCQSSDGKRRAVLVENGPNGPQLRFEGIGAPPAFDAPLDDRDAPRNCVAAIVAYLSP